MLSNVHCLEIYWHLKRVFDRCWILFNLVYGYFRNIAIETFFIWAEVNSRVLTTNKKVIKISNKTTFPQSFYDLWNVHIVELCMQFRILFTCINTHIDVWREYIGIAFSSSAATAPSVYYNVVVNEHTNRLHQTSNWWFVAEAYICLRTVKPSMKNDSVY